MKNSPDNIKFEIFHMPPENTNSVLVSSGDECVIFDAWGRTDDWVHLLKKRNFKLRAIYATHGHSDHISAAPELATKFDVPWYLNSGDHDLIWWGNPLLDYFGIPQIACNCKRPLQLTSGHHTILPGIDTDVILTPGHSQGGVIFYFHKFDILLMGDTLFQDNVGNYTFPGGNLDDLQKSIGKIYTLNLPDETYVVHGHGPDTTIGILKQRNPYFHSYQHCSGCCHDHCHDDCCCNHKKHR